MILPGLGPVLVERGFVRRSRNDKTILQKVIAANEEGGSEDSQRWWDQLREDLDVMLVATRSTGRLRKTIRRKEEELRQRARRNQPSPLSRLTFGSIAFKKDSRNGFRRSASVHAGSNGCHSTHIQHPPPPTSAIRPPSLGKISSSGRYRKYSLGSCISSPSTTASNSVKSAVTLSSTSECAAAEPAVKILSVGDVCSKSSNFASYSSSSGLPKRRRLSLQGLPISDMLLNHHHNQASSGTSRQAVTKFRFVEWSPEEEIKEEEGEEEEEEEEKEEEQAEQEQGDGDDNEDDEDDDDDYDEDDEDYDVKSSAYNGIYQGPPHPMDLQGLQETPV